MKILWITPQLPSLRSGSQVRTYQLIKNSIYKNSITLVSLIRDNEWNEITNIRRYVSEVIPIEFSLKKYTRLRYVIHSWFQVFFDPKPQLAHNYPLTNLNKEIHNQLIINKPDLIIIDSLSLAQLATHFNGIPWIYSTPDVETRKKELELKEMTKVTHHVSGKIDLVKLKKWERQTLRNCDACITVSLIDSDFLKKLSPETKYFVVNNGVDIDYFKPKICDHKREGIIFFGNLEYDPNITGIKKFFKSVYPLIKEKLPNISLNILGPNAPESIKDMGRYEGVNFIGYVEDIRPYLWKSKISIVPLTIGSGTRLKILESIASGCAVVSTSLGAEGLDLDNNHEILIANDNLEFANSVIELTVNDEMRRRMTSAGFRKVSQFYDWFSIGKKFDIVVQNIM